ncbi:GNAT family N-acetyltransferase [Bacteroidales bacterium OttesenSCG-928-L03]|nr:GNAT family N-acetyltransferase [Bacteroidales bacterium OttesenSCG-928-L03]
MFLQSERLILRALEPEDIDQLYQWENDPELWKHGSTLEPYSRFALRDYFENSLRGIAQTGQLRLMAVEKEFGTPIGTVDLYGFDPINSRAGVGILVDKQHQEQGLGTEILGLIQEYGFRFLMLHQLYAHIPRSNTTSRKLFARCGYIETGLMKDWIKTSIRGLEDVYVMQLINPR